jgi:flavin-dependent dehydrogenase
MTIPLLGNDFAHNTAGYVVQRDILDNTIFEAAKKHVESNGGSVKEGAKVVHAIWGNRNNNEDPGEESKDDRVARGIIYLDAEKVEHRVYAEMVIGAGGYNCPIARELVINTYGEKYQERDHCSAAFREYYTDVKGCKPENGEMEIHFIEGILPGYFWIFPAGDGLINVGTGMLLSEMDKTDAKVKKMQHEIIQNHPIFKERFKDAKLIENTSKGWMLPLGSPRGNRKFEPRRSAGNRVLLIGDAASLIDPFTGEGIGNAMVSAKFASESTTKIIEGSDPLIEGELFMKRVWEHLGPELINSDKLQKMLKHRRLMNWIIGKAAKKPKIQAMLTDMLASKESQTKIHSKLFLLRMFLF